MSEELAKQVLMLATDPDKEIRGPVLDALEKVLPRILKRCHGITLSFWALKKLNEITGGDLSYETVTEMAQYAKLSDEGKQAVQALLGYFMIKKMSPMEAIVFLDLKKRFEEGGVHAALGELGDEKEKHSRPD